MNTINMKKVGNTYEQDMDPYSEYLHTPNNSQSSNIDTKETKIPTIQSKIDVARGQMNQVVGNIDEVIEGAELIFEFGDMLAKRFRRF